MQEILKSALWYAENLKWKVFPCSNKDKRPLTNNGFKDATLDKETIINWFTNNPDAYIGVPMGKETGITVIDIDNKKGNDNGFISLEEIEEDTKYKNTVTAITRTKGHHLYYKYDSEIKTTTGVLKGIDIRNDGSYVIVPPSHGYQWMVDQSPIDIELLTIPNWLKNKIIDNNKQNRVNPTFNKDSIPNSMRNSTLIRIAGTYRAKDIAYNAALYLLKEVDNKRCETPLSDKEIEQIIKSAYSYEKPPILSPVKGLEELIDKEHQIEEESDTFLPKDNIELKYAENLKWDYKPQTKKEKDEGIPPKKTNSYNNVVNLLSCREELYNVYRYNEFTNDIEIVKHKPWLKLGYIGKSVDDDDITALRDHLRLYDLQPTTEVINAAITTRALDNSYHPIRNYLNSIKWDGVNRIDKWLTTYCGVTENDYTSYIGVMTLVAACARIDKPGIKYDYMLLLEGKQGIGKSTVVNILGGAWAGSVNIIARDKDTIDKMRGKWFIEVPEMVCLRKSENEAVKDFITTSTDRVRLSYARRAKDFPRQSIFIGTFNPDNYPQGYFTDRENRRFLPVNCNWVDMKSLQRDRDQLLAQAFNLYKKGFPLYIKNKEIMKLAQDQQESRTIKDERSYVVSSFLNKDAQFDEYITTADIWERCFKKHSSDMERRDQQIIGSILRELGWKRKQVRKDSGEQIYAYINPRKNEIKEEEKPEWLD